MSTRGRRGNLARKKTLDYIARLGFEKAARRLETSIKELRQWLETGIPTDRIPLALGLGKPGGQFVYIRGTKLRQLIEEKGTRVLSRLTGIKGAALLDLVAKRPRSGIRFDRDKLAEHDPQKLAELLHTKPSLVRRAQTVPLHKSARKLKEFASTYGEATTASLLGVSKERLHRWLEKGIPASWEDDVYNRLGRREDQGVDRQTAGKKTRNLEQEIARAKKIATAWNKKAPSRRHQISASTVDRWARLGIFDAQLAAIKASVAATKKPTKPTRPKPAPVVPQKPFYPPGTYKPGQAPPKPPATPPPPRPSSPPPPPDDQDKRNFLAARSEAFLTGKYPEPLADWSRYQRWKGDRREGFRFYKRVDAFVRDLDLTRLGRDLIETSKKIWAMMPPSPSQLLTVRFFVSVMGKGNPFYPNAFVPDDEISFVHVAARVHEKDEIPAEIMSALRQLWDVDKEGQTMVYLEYCEFVRSNTVKK